MKNPSAVFLGLLFQLASVTITHAHPRSGIAVDHQGNVFLADINRGLLKFTPDGKVNVVLREAGHWLALDAGKKFAGMDFQKPTIGRAGSNTAILPVQISR